MSLLDFPVEIREKSIQFLMEMEFCEFSPELEDHFEIFEHIRGFHVTILTSANTQDETLPPWSGFFQKDEGENTDRSSDMRDKHRKSQVTEELSDELTKEALKMGMNESLFWSIYIPGNSYAPRTEQKAESAKRERARRRKGQRLRPNGNGQGRNDKMRCPGHPHLERRVEVFGPVALPVPPSSGGACVRSAPPEIGLEALTLPTSRQLMAVGTLDELMRMGVSLAARKTPSADHTERHESAGNASWRSGVKHP
ncbi:hypothetical protein L1987_88358 [Smallanthus sonchifolius]|nr:hypothetical protein L1987_88358 [Smallanthus sonchifolius]